MRVTVNHPREQFELKALDEIEDGTVTNLWIEKTQLTPETLETAWTKLQPGGVVEFLLENPAVWVQDQLTNSSFTVKVLMRMWDKKPVTYLRLKKPPTSTSDGDTTESSKTVSMHVS